MAMKSMGIVTSIDGNIAKITVPRQSACGGNCADCSGCSASAIIIDYEMQTPFQLRLGDKVILSMPITTFLKNAFLSYGIMTILTLSGAVLGYIMFNNEGASVIGALTGLVSGIVIVKIFDKFIKSSTTITKINNQDK